jgi:cytochrome P450
MSFGNGPHRCPGAAVALQETAIFLDRLLRIPNIHVSWPPTVGWNSLTSPFPQTREVREAMSIDPSQAPSIRWKVFK